MTSLVEKKYAVFHRDGTLADGPYDDQEIAVKAKDANDDEDCYISPCDSAGHPMKDEYHADKRLKFESILQQEVRRLDELSAAAEEGEEAGEEEEEEIETEMHQLEKEMEEEQKEIETQANDKNKSPEARAAINKRKDVLQKRMRVLQLKKQKVTAKKSNDKATMANLQGQIDQQEKDLKKHTLFYGD